MATTIKAEQPIRRDWKMKKGADFHRTIKLKESDGVTVRNTTDYAMTMTIKASPNGETYASLSIGNGITNSPASGQFNIDQTAAQVDLFDFASAVYEITITDSSGGKSIPFMGELVLIP
jgi:hypothetical protein